jgi:hypothetical protein
MERPRSALGEDDLHRVGRADRQRVCKVVTWSWRLWADDGRFERSDRVAGAVRTLVRTVDLVWAEGRNVYVLLRECDREMGLAALERMRQALAELSSDKQKIEIGWAVFPEDGLTGGAVLDALCHNRVATIDAGHAPGGLAREGQSSLV